MNVFQGSEDLRTFLLHLTTEPGVYRMFDASGALLYVGKAANLKKRISSYFTQRNTGPKTRSMVSQIHSIKVSVTRNETEALLLESGLIKSLRPKYNVLLRDDKSYPFIYVNTEHPYPRMEMMRAKHKPAKGLCFGPYPNTTAVKETLNMIQKVFKIRNCTNSYFQTRTRPCLQYQINRCRAPCTGLISEGAYRQSVEDAIRFLQGRSSDILEDLEHRMEEAVRSLSFEKAAMLRDQINSLRLIQQQQGIAQGTGDADMIAIKAEPGFACIQHVIIRQGQVMTNQAFFPAVPFKSWDETGGEPAVWQEVFMAFLSYFYVDAPERIPPLIVTHHPLETQEAIETMLSSLRGKSCRIQTKPRGGKARWLEFALNNLKVSINERSASNQVLTNRYNALQQVLQLQQPVTRMACFDVSHTQGDSTVASCVVFDASGPSKSQYRRFNITGVKPGDDYHALEQAITRYFKKASCLPEVLIIDGGKGQVAIANRVLKSLNIQDVKLLGVAKGPSRKAGLERMILAEEPGEVTLPRESPARLLIQHIRDEAHRYAITFHRKKRQKASFASSLELIPGVGARRRQALLRRFGGLRGLAKASVDEITKVSGISQTLAKRIYQQLHDLD